MKKDYMTRLERAARWRLPPQEAEDVIADYQDIFGAPSRSEEELYRDVGDPEQVVKLLVSPPRAYYTWLAVFALMAACILTLGISPTAFGYPFWHLFFDNFWPNHFGPIVAALGAITALVWFRRQGRKSERLPRAVPILLAVLMVWAGAIFFFSWLAMRDPVGFSEALGEVPSLLGPDRMISRSALILNSFLEYSAFALSLLGIPMLVWARTRDRRWAAVYVLAMAVMLASLEPLSLFTRMDVSFVTLTPDWYQSFLGRYAAMFAVGLVGTGVALC